MDKSATESSFKIPSDSMKFIYEPLDTDSNAIRLLTLLSEDTEVIHCTLQHISLINPPDYVALSYCWGDPTAIKDININGMLVQVTSNLESALRHLRVKGFGRLWIDAVCINQQDKTERNQQLLWMGSIYRRAKQVVAWIGEEFDLAIDFINHLGDLEESKSALPTASYTGKRAFFQFLAGPYWRRVWIIQELALARQVTILCGRLETSWSALNSSIHKIANCDENSDVINIRNLEKFRDDAAHNKPVNFLEALSRSTEALSTEPRDKVFALLGLVYDSGLYIPVPNYKQSIKDLCISMTISAMSTSSSLDIIAVLAPFSDRSLLPSWCPNWFALDGTSISRRTNYLLRKSPLLIYGNRENFIDPIPHLTTFGTEAKFTVDRDVRCNEVLRLKSLLFDHIAAIIPSHTENGKDFAVAAEPAIAGIPKKNPYGTEYGLVTAIAKSLVRGGRDFIENIDLLKKVYMYWGESCRDSWFFTATDPTDHQEYARRWVHAAGVLPVQGRTFGEWVNRQPFSAGFMEGCREYAKRRTRNCLSDIDGSLAETKFEGVAYMSTRGGYVGWAYNRAEPGDSIYLLAGCSVPVVLRPRADRGHTVVGYAYVEGIMSGQIMEQASASYERRGSPEWYWADIEIY